MEGQTDGCMERWNWEEGFALVRMFSVTSDRNPIQTSLGGKKEGWGMLWNLSAYAPGTSWGGLVSGMAGSRTQAMISVSLSFTLKFSLHFPYLYLALICVLTFHVFLQMGYAIKEETTSSPGLHHPSLVIQAEGDIFRIAT